MNEIARIVRACEEPHKCALRAILDFQYVDGFTSIETCASGKEESKGKKNKITVFSSHVNAR